MLLQATKFLWELWKPSRLMLSKQAETNWDLHVAGLIYITFVTLFGFLTYAPISYNMPILSVSVIDEGGRIADR